jgi:UDPglucose--hexose-1-phosphate uridylyltransferase
MPELRKDPLLDRWVIMAPERADRPNSFLKAQDDTADLTLCPFCPGNEKLTTGELYAIRAPGTAINTAGWSLRVIPNRFPALRTEIPVTRMGLGNYDAMGGTGAHEVIIETPDHRGGLAKMDAGQITMVLRAWQSRMLDLSRDERLVYAQIFQNVGTPAGATLAHPHSQLIALPIVPRDLSEELQTARDHFARKQRCLLCDLVQQELAAKERVVVETDRFVALAPYASRSPFEVHLHPKLHCGAFEKLSVEDTQSLAIALRTVLRKLAVALEEPALNLFLMTLPLRDPGSPWYHFRIVLKPVLTQPGGFEWGSGFGINPTLPEEAARFLRQTETT